eukprot:202625_1
MALTESIENANKITIELLVHGYLRLQVLPDSESSTIPLKVFNKLLSSIICTDIKTCTVLSSCLTILQQYDHWVNTDKKSKASFVCHIPYDDASTTTSPTHVLTTYFEHISNLHGLTYDDYDALHEHCRYELYKYASSGSNVSVLNECVASSCLILSDDQKQELNKLSAASRHAAINSRSYDTYDYTAFANSPIPEALSQQKSIESMTSDAKEAEDTFPAADQPLRVHFAKAASLSQSVATVTQLLTPSWTAPMRMKWQKHVGGTSSNEMSQFISQLSVLSLLPTINDDEQENETSPLNRDLDDEANRSGLLLPESPTQTMGVDSIDAKEDSESEVTQMSNPPETENGVQNKKKSNKHENELGSKLYGILSEMDLMGKGRLDMTDLSTALSSVRYKDLEYDLMAISMQIFDDEGLSKDDMEQSKIEDIIEYVVHVEDEEVVELREKICEGLGIEYEEDDEETDEEKEVEELQGLVLADKEKSDEPYKPLYAVTTGIQRFGNTNKTKKKKKDETNEDELPETALTITKSIKDEQVSEMLDKIHIYLLHAVHDVTNIPL